MTLELSCWASAIRGLLCDLELKQLQRRLVWDVGLKCWFGRSDVVGEMK